MEEFSISAEYAQRLVEYLWNGSTPVGRPPSAVKQLIDELTSFQQKSMEQPQANNEEQ